MTRPGLIIGLGGSGQWALTWLKRDLLLANGGKMPDNVRLLSIDTTTQLEASAGSANASIDEQDLVEVGGVSLEDHEFIYLGGDSKPIAEAVKRGEFPQIGKWYQAQKWLDTQSPAAFILDEGAGRIRQFGRMAVAKDLLKQETGSNLWLAFQSAIRDVQEKNRSTEIIVVGSLAGGTGSGMFIDIALLLRSMVESASIDHILRGFIALPSVFTSTPRQDMLARSFAAWRELNRFMVINSDFPMPAIEYVEKKKNFKIVPKSRIFDACYLIDGKRNGQPLAEEAHYGVHPMIAEVISALLDEEAGTKYTQWISTNLNPEYAKYPETPMYSAIGAYSIQVPAHFVQEISSHQFGQQLLLRLLNPTTDPDKEERFAVTGAERHLVLAAPDKNKEDEGYRGRHRAQSIFSEAASYMDKNIKPSLFMQQVGQLIETSEDSRKVVIDNFAKAGANARSKNSWAASFPDLGNDQTFKITKDAIDKHMNFNVLKEYRRRDDETAEDFHLRLKKLDDDLTDRFGHVVHQDDRIDEFHGESGKALKNVQKVQLTIFRQLIKTTLLKILMGTSDDILEARSGKLGYACDYFNGLESGLNDFVELMSDIQKRREEIKPELRIAGIAKKAREIMNQNQGNRIFFWEHWNVAKSEQEYLKAYQRLVSLRREELLHFYVVQTVREMKKITTNVKNELRTWILHLSTGDDSRNLSGLWNDLLDSKKQTTNAHEYDKAIDSVQALLKDKLLPVAEDDIKHALSRWSWEINFDDNQMHLTADISSEIKSESSLKLVNPIREEAPNIRTSVARKNQEFIMNLSRRPFLGFAKRTTISDSIQEEYPDPANFVANIAATKSEPLVEVTPGGAPIRSSNLIRLQTSETDEYFMGSQGVQGELRARKKLSRDQIDDNYGIQMVGSENPYKFTLVRSDDLYRYNHYKAWHDCMEAYEAHISGDEVLLDPVLLHNFSAEAQAVIYERRLQKATGRSYQPLHPRVVMLLEDVNAFRQFLNLYMLQQIGVEEDYDGYRWELEWEKARGSEIIWLTTAWQQDQHDGKRKRPDIFNAIHGYVTMRRTQQSGFDYRIDNRFAHQFIESRLMEQAEKAKSKNPEKYKEMTIDEIKQQREIKLLEGNLKAGGLVESLYKESLDDDNIEIVAQDFYDLSKVVQMLLEERLQVLEGKKKREEKGRLNPGRRKASGFSVFTLDDE